MWKRICLLRRNGGYLHLIEMAREAALSLEPSLAGTENLQLPSIPLFLIHF
jgi:hypothetical protein